ncbi:unnamed protein product, partial [Didymodactylos carnosus]
FARVSYTIRQLTSVTQQARAAFQYATLNVFQTSRQHQLSSIANPSTATSLPSTTTAQQNISTMSTSQSQTLQNLQMKLRSTVRMTP